MNNSEEAKNTHSHSVPDIVIKTSGLYRNKQYFV